MRCPILHQQPVSRSSATKPNRPILEHAVILQPQVKMMGAGMVLLDNESKFLGHSGKGSMLPHGIEILVKAGCPES
jgi:hypothetical protein